MGAALALVGHVCKSGPVCEVYSLSWLPVLVELWQALLCTLLIVCLFLVAIFCAPFCNTHTAVARSLFQHVRWLRASRSCVAMACSKVYSPICTDLKTICFANLQRPLRIVCLFLVAFRTLSHLSQETTRTAQNIIRT